MRERVAIYCRLSEEDRDKKRRGDESGSIGNQRAMLTAYAEQMGWAVFDVYVDDDYAGADRTRPAFVRMLSDAERGCFDIVLCKTQSRFTRELELVERYIHGLFPLWGIRFVSIVDNADTANKGNKKSRQINGLVNEWYLEDMSESIKAALDSRRKNGFHIGSFALYGYRKDPDAKGRLLIDEEAAAVVREVFSLFSKGYGKTAIARMLNERGIPNPTEYKRRQGLHYRHPSGRGSTLWKYAAISSMLTNQTYIGNMVQGRYHSVSYKSKINRPRPKEEWFVVEGTHEPIIDRTLWERVQEMIANRTKPFSEGAVGVFSGKARCACCGYALRSSRSGGKRFLQCPTRYAAKDACCGAFISEERLEKTVIDELNRLSATYLDRDALARGLDPFPALQAQRDKLEKEWETCRTRLEEYGWAVREAYLDKVRGRIGEEELMALNEDVSARRAVLLARMSACEAQLNTLSARMETEEDSRALVDRYVNVTQLTREMAEVLIDRILVGKRIAGTRDVPVEIRWNF